MASPHKKQKIGLWTSTSLVVGNMIGAGVFLTPAAMASFGSVSLLGWGFAAIGTFFVARVFSSLSKLLPNIDGGPYIYTRHGLGDLAGFLIAWGYYISNAAGLAATVVSFISAMTTFLPVLATNPIIAVCTGFSTIVILSYVNCLGVVTSGKVQLVTTILKLVPLILIGIGGLFFIKLKNFMPFNSSGTSVLSAINTTAAIAMFSFIGVECATVPAGEVDDSGNNVAKATMIGLFVSAIVYIAGSISIMGMIPTHILAHSPTPYADAAELMIGHNARYWISAGMAISAFGAINGWILIQGQLGYGVAKDKLFPQAFAKINNRNVPWFSILINGVLICVMVFMNYSKGLVDQFKAIMLIAVLTTVIPYLFSAAAYPLIRAKKGITAKNAAAFTVAILAFAYSLWAIAGTGEDSVYWGFILLMLGIPFYIGITYKKTKEGL